MDLRTRYKTSNCQTLVSLTLARGEVPVMLALRLFLPESWTSNRARLERAGVPAEYRTARTKPEMALAEIDRAIAAGPRLINSTSITLISKIGPS
jgi:SRSO17 transposase